MSHLLPLAAALLAVPTIACGSELEAAPAVQCTSDRQCADGLRCDFDYCIADGTNALTLQARILPPADSGLLAQQVTELTFEEGPDRLIKLLAPTTVRGTVVPKGDTFNVNVPGDLEVRTPGDIEGLDYRFTARSRSGVDAEGLGYALQLLPGRRYEGTFRPDDPAIPPHAFVITADEVMSGRFDVVLPAASERVVVEGRVRTSDYVPIGDARVSVLLADGTTLGSTVTDVQRGRFALVLPPGHDRVRFKVQAPSAAGDAAASPIFPDYTTEPLPADDEADVIIPALPPGLGPIDVTLSIVGETDGGGVVGQPGMTVTLAGDLAGGTLRRTATSNDQGVVVIGTLPGAYEVLVTSPPGSPYASWHGWITLADNSRAAVPRDNAVTITLPPRVPLVGEVRDLLGELVASGTIHATRRVDRGPDDVLTIASPPYQGPIVDGRYQLMVEPGTYDLRVVPAAATGAPAITIRDQAVDVGLSVDVDLPPPGLAHITIAGPDGAFLGDVTVELYEAPDPRGTLDGEDTEDALPRLLVRGVTGDAGFVDLLVPFHVAP